MLSLLIGLAHWNPHWQCFSSAYPACTAGATNALDMLLQTGTVDFVNVIEFERGNATYVLPEGWASIGAYESCGTPHGDWDTLFYYASRWSVVGAPAVGCIVKSRSFVAATFQHRETSQNVTIVGAHYPQTLNASTHAYEDATASLRQIFSLLPDSGGKAVLLADTNTESPAGAARLPDHHGLNKTNRDILFDLGLWSSKIEPPAAPLYRGCCYSDGFSWQGDRIIATFGKVVSSQILFDDPVPTWAAFPSSEFHKGMRLTLEASFG